jgi:hypothetical protein
MARASGKHLCPTSPHVYFLTAQSPTKVFKSILHASRVVGKSARVRLFTAAAQRDPDTASNAEQAETAREQHSKVCGKSALVVERRPHLQERGMISDGWITTMTGTHLVPPARRQHGNPRSGAKECKRA